MRLLAVPLGLAGVVMVGWGLIRGVLTMSVESRVAQILLALGALFLVVEALVACWDRLPVSAQRQTQISWRWRTRRLMRSRPLSLWPVVLVLLTALLGFTDWFPASDLSRPIMLGLIATVGLYGYFREKSDQKRSLVAFADVARYRFTEEAKRIHRERDRDIEAKEYGTLEEQQAKGRQDEEAEIDRLLGNV